MLIGRMVAKRPDMLRPPPRPFAELLVPALRPFLGVRLAAGPPPS